MQRSESFLSKHTTDTGNLIEDPYPSWRPIDSVKHSKITSLFFQNNLKSSLVSRWLRRDHCRKPLLQAIWLINL